MDSYFDVQHHGTNFKLKVILKKIQNVAHMPLWQNKRTRVLFEVLNSAQINPTMQ